jgi:hypothetical protein
MMKRKGINFSHAPHLSFRYAKPEDMARCSDYNVWEPSRSGYCVIVRKKDCKDDGSGYLVTDDAPCIPFSAWSRTNMVYGRWRTQTRGARFWVSLSDLDPGDRDMWLASERDHGTKINWNEDGTDGRVAHWFDTYYTLAVYWVESGAVYSGTIRTHNVPDALKEVA